MSGELVEQIAANMWRLRRAINSEATFTDRAVKGVSANREKAEGWLAKDAIIITDLRVEKTHRFGARDISLFFDLYNMFNQNPEQNINSTSGTTFLRPLSIVPPRLFRIGAKLNF